MIADIHILLEIFPIDMLTALKAQGTPEAEVRRCSTWEGKLIHLPFIKNHSRVLHTLAGSANFAGYCGCLTTTVHILYRVLHLERGQIFETVNRTSSTYERGQIFETVNETSLTLIGLGFF